MRCVRCGADYIGMKKASKFNCPHCSFKWKDRRK